MRVDGIGVSYSKLKKESNGVKQFFKNYIQDIVPYEPGKPIEEVERELGLLRVTKLASNENPLGPSFIPTALPMS